jgi:hypothetical protein
MWIQQAHLLRTTSIEKQDQNSWKSDAKGKLNKISAVEGNE